MVEKLTNEIITYYKKVLGCAFIKGDLDHLFSRIGIFLDQAKHFVLEKDYGDAMWKQMVSLHYVNTTYNLSPRSLRIHFFLDSSEEEHLGFVTLRTINEPAILLSSIMPNWDKLDFCKYLKQKKKQKLDLSE